jgi:hypothetical protein
VVRNQGQQAGQPVRVLQKVVRAGCYIHGAVMTRMRAGVVGCCLVTSIAFSSHSLAQPKPEILTSITSERLAAVLRTAGYRAEVATRSSGDPRLRTGLGGYNVTIDFYGCEEKKRCKSLQFYAGFKKDSKFTPKFVNAWNREKRYAKVYLDDDAELNFEFDVSVDGGVTPEFLREQILLYERLLSQLAKFEVKP